MFIDRMVDLVVWPVVLPLIAAALTLLLRGKGVWQRSVMEFAVALTALSSGALLWRVVTGGPQPMRFGGWGAPFGITFVADMLSAAMCAAAALVAIMVAIFARADIRDRRRNAGFDALFLALLASVNGAFLTGDLFNLYVWFELMLVTAVGLITIDRRRSQVDGGFRYIVMSMLGATFILIGVALLYGETGTLDLAHLSLLLGDRQPTLTLTTSAYLLLAGMILKAGMFPLFFWLPASYHTAPISVAAALAGLLTKVAFYACLRVFVVVFGLGNALSLVPGMPSLLAVVASATMLVSVFAAIAQVDLRRLLANHVMAQVAYLVMGLAIATAHGIAAATFYTVHTMLLQTGLFLAAGAIGRVQRTYDIRAGGSLIFDHPTFAALFAVLALSISGIPPFSGFWAKALVIDAAIRSDLPWAGALVIVAVIGEIGRAHV